MRQRVDRAEVLPRSMKEEPAPPTVGNAPTGAVDPTRLAYRLTPALADPVLEMDVVGLGVDVLVRTVGVEFMVRTIVGPVRVGVLGCL
jgi:hypothetical protein